MRQVCTSSLAYHAQLSICVKRQSFSFKLHVIPNRAIGSHYMPKHCYLVKSFKADVPPRQNHDAYDLSASNSFQRSKALFGHSDGPLDGDKDFEGQLQELFDEVKAMIKMGNKNDAVDLLQANFEAVKEQMSAGAKGMEEAAILDIIALGYIAIGDFKFVESLLDMLSELVDCLEDDEFLLDSVLIHMASMYSTLGNFEKSMLMYQRVNKILERKYGENGTFLVTPLLGMAKVLGSTGRAIKAEETYHRAISILESSRGAESEDLVVPLYGLGNLLIKEGKTMNVESPFIRILNIYTKLYGENDGRVGMAMCSLADAKCAKGKADEAIVLYKKAIQVIKDSNYMASDDSTLEKMRIDLAELLHAVGRVKEGRELLEECLLILEQYNGKEHPNLITHLLNLATSYSQSRNFVEAERLLRTSLDIMTKSVGPDDQSISFPMLNLAVILFHLNRKEEAEQLALEVLRIREGAFGKDSLPVGEALDCLASIKTRLGRDDNELLDLLKRVLRIQEREFGHDSEEVMETLKKVVFYSEKLGRKDEKLLLQRRLSILRKKHKQKVHY